MTFDQIIEEIESLVYDAFNQGISCGHPMSSGHDQDRARKEHKERIAELRSQLQVLMFTARNG